MGATSHQLGDPDKAIQDHKQAVEIYSEKIGYAPRFADFYYKRGLALYQLDEHEKAVDDFTKAIGYWRPIDWEPWRNPGKIYYQRGKAWNAIGVKTLANTDFQEAKRLDPSIELDNE